MTLSQEMRFGYVLPCRSWAPIDMQSVRNVAQRADALGFDDLWVTENTLDDSFSLDATVVLTYAAALTTRIRLGASVVVLPQHSPVQIAHQWATLDYASGGRAILGVGLGRPTHYGAFGVPVEHRVSRFVESIELIKTLWTQPQPNFHGRFFDVEHGMAIRPVQQPHPPIWLGGSHPDAIRRAAKVADGWMAAGGAGKAIMAEAVPMLHEALAKAGRDPKTFPISKRVFMSVHEDASKAKTEALRWFTDVYHNPAMLETNGFYGTPEHAREYIEEMHALGATHLLLNPITRYEEQLEALAEVTGLGS